MGRKPGEPLVRIAEVEVCDVRREPLKYLWGRPGYGAQEEMVAEGFPDMDPWDFYCKFFLAAQGIDFRDDVTRIEWRYQ